MTLREYLPLHPLISLNLTLPHPFFHIAPVQEPDEIDLLGPDVTRMSLNGFIAWVQTSSEIGSIRIDEVQHRRSNRLPFYHEYIVVLARYSGIDVAIRLDRWVSFCLVTPIRNAC